jgi:hypothetical protein
MCQNCVRIEFPFLCIIFFFTFLLNGYFTSLPQSYFYNESRYHVTNALHSYCSPYLQEFILLLPNKSASVATTGDGFSEWPSFFTGSAVTEILWSLNSYYIRDNVIHTSFAFHDRNFDSIKSNHSSPWQTLFGIDFIL